MRTSLLSIRKSTAGSVANPVYALTLLTGGKRRRCHAIVRTRHAHAISFRENWADALLAMNIDQGSPVYKAILELHRDGQVPNMPLRLGNFASNGDRRSSARSPASMAGVS